MQRISLQAILRLSLILLSFYIFIYFVATGNGVFNAIYLWENSLQSIFIVLGLVALAWQIREIFHIFKK